MISKCITRMMKGRLEWRAECTMIFSITQEAYRVDHTCGDLTTRFTQTIQEALNENKTVILVISDFKAYFHFFYICILRFQFLSYNLKFYLQILEQYRFFVII